MTTETLKKAIANYEAHPENKQFQEQLAKLKKAYETDEAFKAKHKDLFSNSKKK